MYDSVNVPSKAAARATETVCVFGPASLSNLGPGFDTVGLCLSGLGDVVRAGLSDRPGVRILRAGAEGLPTDPLLNTAGRSAAAVLRQARSPFGIDLDIEKRIPIGSGIGGSAACAAAGAWAANLLLGRPFERCDLVEAALEGEAVASGGCRHGDNVLPALLGGMVLTSPVDPADYRRIFLPKPLPIAVVLPRVEILTSEARALLPERVAFRSAVENASDLAFLLDALRCGDWPRAGRYMMRDRLVEPVRAGLVPCYEAVREAALDSGALGCALTGSGPAMFAIANTRAEAEAALAAMREACRRTGTEAGGLVTDVNPNGAQASGGAPR